MKLKKLQTALSVATLSALSIGTVQAKLVENNAKLNFEIEQFEYRIDLSKSAEYTAEQLKKVLTKLPKEQRPEELASLTFRKKKSSLLADHYHFHQTVEGIPVWGSGFVISVDRTTGKIKRTYDSLVPVSKLTINKNLTNRINNKDSALNVAWDFLQPSGDLLAKPKINLVYVPRGKELVLAYKTELSLSEPRGSWRHLISVETGEVLKASRVDSPRKSSNDDVQVTGKIKAFKQNPNKVALTTALELLAQKEQQRVQLNDRSTSMIDATGFVFDPDPKTTLNDDTIDDRSLPEVFDPAYFTETLRDVTFDDATGLYSLVGPYVQVVDFDLPSTRPTTTNDGVWTGKRGEPQFYDSMVYFHLDSYQRYLQSLGFTGETGIFEESIVVDSDASNDADNSYFDPINRRLGFGHGGIPDPEDADVIIHEYGHAIHSDINDQWTADAADNGAMGEGFGDYLAGSYSYSTANGQTFFPNRVFQWDGHNEFYPGRTLDQVQLRYDSAQFYGDHEIVDGVIDGSDMLWSTPLFQSFIELTDAGYSRESVDQLVIESQFGLDYGLTMPEMATSIVSTAVDLFPGDDHAAVFFKWFKEVNILDDQPLKTMPVVVEGGVGSNGAPDPGELVTFKVPLSSDNPVTITGLNADLSSTSTDITITANSSEYAEVPAYSTRSNTVDFEMRLSDEMACGNRVSMSLDTAYTVQGNDTPTEQTLLFNFYTGAREVITQSNQLEAVIPDNDPEGFSSTVTMENLGLQVDDNFSLYLDLAHTFRGDLLITLTSPTGTRITVKSPDENEGENNITGRFPQDFIPQESFDAFNGENLNGDWTLFISDNAGEDIGQLISWSLSASGVPNCDEIPADDTAQNIIFGLAAVVIIGVNAGSVNWMFCLLVCMAWLRRRNYRR
ncbi:MAG: proprotein convertase P-domain-containing protein [Gammaproteobacteria bacterium]|nr:proprotein convertase P-domain-containing protein [Gammaproteobacteria bacterium]